MVINRLWLYSLHSKLRACDLSPLEECKFVVKLLRSGTVFFSAESKYTTRQLWRGTAWKHTLVRHIKEGANEV